jgi:hypothetical protein
MALRIMGFLETLIFCNRLNGCTHIGTKRRRSCLIERPQSDLGRARTIGARHRHTLGRFELPLEFCDAQRPRIWGLLHRILGGRGYRWRCRFLVFPRHAYNAPPPVELVPQAVDDALEVAQTIGDVALLGVLDRRPVGTLAGAGTLPFFPEATATGCWPCRPTGFTAGRAQNRKSEHGADFADFILKVPPPTAWSGYGCTPAERLTRSAGLLM